MLVHFCALGHSSPSGIALKLPFVLPFALLLKKTAFSWARKRCMLSPAALTIYLANLPFCGQSSLSPFPVNWLCVYVPLIVVTPQLRSDSRYLQKCFFYCLFSRLFVVNRSLLSYKVEYITLLNKNKQKTRFCLTSVVAWGNFEFYFVCLTLTLGYFMCCYYRNQFVILRFFVKRKRNRIQVSYNTRVILLFFSDLLFVSVYLLLIQWQGKKDIPIKDFLFIFREQAEDFDLFLISNSLTIR